MKVFYSDKLVAVQGKQSFGQIQSPSARKPKEIAQAISSLPGIEFVEPNPLTIEDIKLCHDPAYVDGVMDLSIENGFGTKEKSICDSLLYTNGAMYDAVSSATANAPTCALVSGFHHAGYLGWQGLGYFCTFNGLMIAALKSLPKKIAIIDCDMHWGNGTDDILERNPQFKDHVIHVSFGRIFTHPSQAQNYLSWLEPDEIIEVALHSFNPDIIIYQAGADVHIDDPYGGVLTTEQMFERDRRVFSIAKRFDIPLAWNLAGGYQIDANGSIQKVIDLHLNTFKACQEVYERNT
jgi:acetoin utilization deacetylase AcuC-like enzyme